EIQMLYGMAEPIKDALVSLKQRVRVYTPYGQLIPGMAYLVRRLLENTSDDSFLRASFTEHVPEEQLLMNPLKRVSGGGVSGGWGGGGAVTLHPPPSPFPFPEMTPSPILAGRKTPGGCRGRPTRSASSLACPPRRSSTIGQYSLKR